MVVPTTIPYISQDPKNPGNELNAFTIETVLADLNLEDIQDTITLLPYDQISANATPTTNPLLKGLKAALEDLPKDLLISLELTANVLLTSFPSTFTLYKPILLLPPNALSSPPWTTLLADHPPTSPLLQSIWSHLAKSVGSTHVAINAGIPLQQTTTSTPSTKPSPEPNENILRSPRNLTPLYGDFGPLPTSQTLAHPTAADFTAAFWVEHIQNGIHQIWAPLYTMFSRGNMREKTRLLNHPDVKASAEVPSTAVDLYAGIGYFAFPYKRAGIRKLLCWELNPWSIEGLRRGAMKNKWTSQIFGAGDMPATDEEWAAFAQKVQDVDFVVFQQSNEEAFRTLAHLHPRGLGIDTLPVPATIDIPPIRHVNCGFLPSSKLSWPTAVKILDREIGGWVRAHENVGTADIERRKVEVVAEMQGYVNAWDGERSACGSWVRRVECRHVERVKTFAPGVVHVVFDVWVSGIRDRQDIF